MEQQLRALSNEIKYVQFFVANQQFPQTVADPDHRLRRNVCVDAVLHFAGGDPG